ncbi:unnamed protein product [Lactuca saligna]|uniref:Uncharacterized protein n=1 Tax=Lactuca saligna TaxID=75948 RepID=A0AA35ZSZ2_LACSI|nr:unnamed protein product [Lactuca saligna]
METLDDDIREVGKEIMKAAQAFAQTNNLDKEMDEWSDQTQGGEAGSGKVEPPKVLAMPIVKKELKGKDKLIEEEPIIDDDEDNEPDEAELKRRKARDAE